MGRSILPPDWGEAWSNLRRVFRQADARSLEATLADLESPDSQVRHSAVVALDRHEEWDSVPGLLRALEDTDVKVRGAAALYLGSRQAPGVLDALLEHFYHDPSPHVQLMCSTHLDRWPDDPRVKGAYLHLFASVENRRIISACAGAQRLRIMEAVPHMMRLLDSTEYLQRQSACEALTALGVRDPKIVAVLEALVLSPEFAYQEQMRAELTDMLCGDEEEAPIPTLRDVLEQARQPAPS